MRSAFKPAGLLTVAICLALLSGAGRAQDAAGTPAKVPVFDILEFRVEGNSTLSKREIERTVMPFLGKRRRFADVDAARKALEDAYQKAGYQTVFVEIPEQKVTSGVVLLRVLEGTVGQTQVSGSRYFELGEIRAGVPELAPGKVPDFPEMQRELAQVNKNSDRQLAPILTPGRTPGTVDVNLSVKDALPLHGDIEDDNHATPFTTADRANFALRYDNLWQAQHSLAVNYQISPQKLSEANVVYASYLWRFAHSDQVLSAYAIRSNSNISVVGSSTILGQSKIAGARWILPAGSGVSDNMSFFHAFTLGIDRKDFAQTNISAQSADLTVLPQITYFPLSFNYSFTGVRSTRTSQLSLGFVTAPRDVFGNTDAKFQSRRALGNASWYAWKWDVSIDQALTSRWSVFGRTTGQWTFDALIPNEQFITGGADSVRGYRESEVTGDRGAQATLEVRYYPRERSPNPTDFSLYVCAFGDGAQVRLVDPAGPQISIQTLVSSGLGLHLRNWHGLHSDLDVAKTMRDGGSGSSGPITRRGTIRAEASLGYSF